MLRPLRNHPYDNLLTMVKQYYIYCCPPFCNKKEILSLFFSMFTYLWLKSCQHPECYDIAICQPLLNQYWKTRFRNLDIYTWQIDWVWYEGVFELLQTITGKYRGGTQWGMWIETLPGYFVWGIRQWFWINWNKGRTKGGQKFALLFPIRRGA